MRILSLITGVVIALVLATAPARSADRAQVPFNKVELFIEFNSTDGDAGIQAFFDGDAWKAVRIVGPTGRTIFEVEAELSLKKIGLTELRFESEEPSLAEILGSFPPGEYKFVGRTIDGDVLRGAATLSHDIPAAPSVSPSNGALVDRDNAVITWNAIPGVARFQVVVTQENLGVSMTVDLSASTTSLRVPPTFLQANTEYKAEVLATSPSGNRTITEVTFVTLP